MDSIFNERVSSKGYKISAVWPLLLKNETADMLFPLQSSVLNQDAADVKVICSLCECPSYSNTQ